MSWLQGPRRPGQTLAPARPGSRLGPALAWAGIAAVALALFAQLVPQAMRAVLGEDECFHAHLARWIAEHGRLPERLPELYGGLFYSYPPLFHLLGAAWVRLQGLTSLPLLDVVLYAALLGALALIPVPGLARTPRRWALWLVIANATLAGYAVRLYAEMLTCLLGLLVALLLMRLAATRHLRDGLLLGVVGGLAMLAKNTALVVPALLIGYVLAQCIARRRDGALAGALALAVALAIATPMLVRNQVLFGSPIYPGLARDVDPWLYQFNRTRFGRDLPDFLADVWKTFGPWVLSWGALAAVLAIVTRRRDAVAGLMVSSIGGIVLASLSPFHEARHVMPLIPVIALSGAVILHDALRERRLVLDGVEYGLAALALVTTLTLGDRRVRFDVQPRFLEAYAAIKERVPAGSQVLSLWTYETFYYSERAATWPIPWGQGERSPSVLFRESDPARFQVELDRLGIEWVLMPRVPGAERFDGANYPQSFMSCLVAMVEQRAMRVAWHSPSHALVARVRQR